MWLTFFFSLWILSCTIHTVHYSWYTYDSGIPSRLLLGHHHCSALGFSLSHHARAATTSIIVICCCASDGCISKGCSWWLGCQMESPQAQTFIQHPQGLTGAFQQSTSIQTDPSFSPSGSTSLRRERGKAQEAHGRGSYSSCHSSN